MTYDAINLEISDHIGWVTLNRPDKMNALNAQLRKELTDVLSTAQSRDLRVLVITGSGAAFCSGQDLSDSGSLASIDLERTLRDEYVPLINAMRNCPIPTIAAVNGPAAGAGANLALAADVVIAARSAFFSQAFVRIGLAPDAGGTYLLPRQVGMARAMGMMLFGENVTALEAQNWGMIWDVVEDNALMDEAKARAVQLANGPTAAYGVVKKALAESFDNSFDQQLALEARLQGGLGKTHDFKEGVLAFIEKRPAKFEGR